jgi:hypothetical protein
MWICIFVILFVIQRSIELSSNFQWENFEKQDPWQIIFTSATTDPNPFNNDENTTLVTSAYFSENVETANVSVYIYNSNGISIFENSTDICFLCLCPCSNSVGLSMDFIIPILPTDIYNGAMSITNNGFGYGLLTFKFTL